jgi:DNA replication protein DnaC
VHDGDHQAHDRAGRRGRYPGRLPRAAPAHHRRRAPTGRRRRHPRAAIAPWVPGRGPGGRVDERAQRRRVRRTLEAKFPRIKRLEEFDTTAASGVPPTTIATLTQGAFIDAATPVVLLGDSGTGKSHLLIGMGVAACEAGRRVRYVTTAALVNELVEAAGERVLARTIARYGRYDLLLLDELGYLHLDPRGAELLFQVLTDREEKASVAAASNAPFSEGARPSPTHAWPPRPWTGSPSTP